MTVATGANIAMALLGMVITAIVLGSCLEEKKDKDLPVGYFMALLIVLTLTLFLDAVSQTCMGLSRWRMLHMIACTLVSIGGCTLLALFTHYLKRQLPHFRKVMTVISYGMTVLCCAVAVSLLFNLHYGFYFTVDACGSHVPGAYMWLLYLYRWFGLLVCILTVVLYPAMNMKNRLLFVLCAVCPLVGTVIDYIWPHWSLTYIGALVGVIALYTNHYLQQHRTISEQRTALMISQINPHFMYNTLTTIASMCDLDPKEAKKLTIEFSSYLRQNLNTLSTSQLISFEQEMRHVECYLKIEKARFRDQLNIVYNLDHKAFSLPALTVQPLVENAVRHGISKRPNGGTLKIVSYERDNMYVIEIIDDGVGFDPERRPDDGRSHVGVENVRNRLKDMCGGTLTIKSKADVGSRAMIEIPVKRTRRAGKR